ncbi:unnamed protein product, partial [Meganyctiphanes norvegica]
IQRYGLTLTIEQEVMIWSIIVSVFQVGAIIGAFTGSKLADYIGRSKAFLLNHILCLVGSLLFITCKLFKLVEMLFLSRFVLGLSGGIADSLVTLYLAENAPPSYGGSY